MTSTIADDTLSVTVHCHSSAQGSQTVREMSGKSVTNSQIQLNTDSYCMNLTIVKVDGIFGSMDNMSLLVSQTCLKVGVAGAYAFSVLLNRALLIWRFALPFRASVLTSPPMCSPSRSQSVQIKRAMAPRACMVIFVAIASFSYEIWSCNAIERNLSGIPLWEEHEPVHGRGFLVVDNSNLFRSLHQNGHLLNDQIHRS